MATLKSSDKRVIDDALAMGSGYILNFTERTFAAVFKDEFPNSSRMAGLETTVFPPLLKFFLHSFSNPWLVNLSVRQFSPTVRTVPSGIPEGTLA